MNLLSRLFSPPPPRRVRYVYPTRRELSARARREAEAKKRMTEQLRREVTEAQLVAAVERAVLG